MVVTSATLQFCSEIAATDNGNTDLQHAIVKKVLVRTKAKVKHAITEHMVKLEQSPDRVKSFFLDPRVNYAA